MRTSLLVIIVSGLTLALFDLRTEADDGGGTPEAENSAVEARFREQVRPFLESYCLRCHGTEKPKGDMNLSGFTSAESVAKDLPRWELVLEQLEAGSMPPAKAKPQPTARGPRRRSSPGSGRFASSRRRGTRATPARSRPGG